MADARCGVNMADAPSGESIAQCLQYRQVARNTWVGPQGPQLAAYLELHCSVTNNCHLAVDRGAAKESHIKSEKHKKWVALVTAGYYSHCYVLQQV